MASTPLAACLVAAWGLGAACGKPFADPTPPPTAYPATPAPASAPVMLHFAGFSATREALGTRALPAFAQSWQRRHARAIGFHTQFAGSESLTREIAEGSRADVVVLALARDLETLAAAGLLDRGWQDRPHGGIVCRSLVVLAVRKGNPKSIRNWADLARPGVRVVTPDPATSGGGVWNVCALHGAALRGHAGVPANDPTAARNFVHRVLANVVARAPNSGESFRSFQDGIGDVAITYESEVALGWMFGHDDERVVPTSTLLVESPAAVLAPNADAHGVRAEAQALLDWLWTAEAQQHFAACGLRPVDPTVAAASRAQFPLPQDLWTIDYLGDWQQITREVLAPADAEPPPRPGR